MFMLVVIKSHKIIFFCFTILDIDYLYASVVGLYACVLATAYICLNTRNLSLIFILLYLLLQLF